MLLSIIILTKCTNSEVYRCLQSIKDHIAADVLSQSEILVGYTGNDNTEVQKLSAFSLNNLAVKRLIRYHFASNCNELAQIASGRHLLFLNDDVEFVDDSISVMLRYFEQDKAEQFGAIGLKLLYADNRIQHLGHVVYVDAFQRFKGISHIGLNQPNHASNDQYVIGVTGACLGIRKSQFLKLGMFNEKYEHCFEDVELCWNCLIDGKVNVCIGTSFAYHRESTSRKTQKTYLSQPDIQLMTSFFNKNSTSILRAQSLLSSSVVRV